MVEKHVEIMLVCFDICTTVTPSNPLLYSPILLNKHFPPLLTPAESITLSVSCHNQREHI